MEAPNGAQVGPGKTQREKIFEAVEALRLLLGQGVPRAQGGGFDSLPPLPLLPKVTPIPRLNSSVLSNLPSCLKKKPDLRRKFKWWRTG